MRQQPRLQFAVKLQSISMEDESCQGVPALLSIAFYKIFSVFLVN